MDCAGFYMTIVDHSGLYKDLVDYNRLCWTQLDCSTAEGSVGLEQTMLGCTVEFAGL